MGEKRGKLVDMKFSAAYLVRVCGMSIQWTDCLSDHLATDSQGKVLTIYKHKIFLPNHLKSNEPYPILRSVLEEALDTLNLLFPFGDAATRQLLAREKQLGFYGLGGCKRDRDLNIQRYRHWREELDSLVDSFNRPPRTWKQLVTDRRNPKDYITFWLTVMVALMTVVRIPGNIISAMFAVKAYQVQLAQGSNPRPD